MQSPFLQTDQHYQPYRVLVADPDPDTLALYRESFALAGCDVAEASDGRDALTKALVRTPTLVVTELRLPKIDGIALCEILRRDRSTATVPILVVTAEARHTELQRIHNAGADAVFVKPTTPDAVLTRARELLASSVDLRARSATARATADDRLQRSAAVLARSQALQRKMLVKAHHRGVTTTPALTPPVLRCPSCDGTLTYHFSHVGGVNALHAEQWDYYACSTCGPFQYRQRTRKIRRVDPSDTEWVNRLKQSIH